jgi:hypothetical protein
MGRQTISLLTENSLSELLTNFILHVQCNTPKTSEFLPLPILKLNYFGSYAIPKNTSAKLSEQLPTGQAKTDNSQL